MSLEHAGDCDYWRYIAGGERQWQIIYTTNTTADPGDTKTYSQGFDDGWIARGVSEGKSE